MGGDGADGGHIRRFGAIFNSYLLNTRVHFYHATSVPTHAPKPPAGDCQLRDSLIFKLYLVIFVSI